MRAIGPDHHVACHFPHHGGPADNHEGDT
jgi:hypothetical protein